MGYRSTTNGTKASRGNRGYSSFTEGNTVRKLNVVKELQRPIEVPKISHNTQKNRDKALYMNLGYVLFLVAALVGAAMILINYIKIQSELTLTVKNIANLESQLNDLRLSNDEDYSRAASSVDLEEIRRVAIGELGMRYAKEGQIINVQGEGSDYVRQLADFEE
ncbi:MAG: cell division protein FtsL [Lachnospiraceae bacterium]|nr:cell division protein FtsL [Lachnospiraceae bacterium]